MRKPSPAMVVALLALFVALGGTGIAAGNYIITSTKQIKPSVLRSLKGQRGPTGPQGPRGLTGLTGLTGTTGPTGPQGTPGVSGVQLVTGPDVQIPAGANGNATTTCPPGKQAISGGFYSSIGEIFSSFGGGNVWYALVANTSSITITVHGYAICAIVT